MKGKIRITAKFHRTDLVICSHSRERKPPSYSRRNTVIICFNPRIFLQSLPEYQVAHERAVYKAIAIVADTKKVVQNINIDKLHELRAMQKPIIDIEDLMAAIIMICEYNRYCC